MISSERGKVLMDGKYGSFCSEDICEFLKKVSHTFGKKHKYAIYWDNASYHSSNQTRDYCTNHDIPVIYNAPFRPDLNGIERFWAKVKYRYK